MTTWQTIFGVDAPIRGSTSEFAAARDAFGRMRDDAQTILDSFGTVRSNGNAPDHLEGQAGAMLAQLLGDMDDRLTHLPSVAGSAEDIFSAHYDRLVELHDLADEALGRAQTAWNARTDADERITTLEQQIRQLEGDIENAPDGTDTGSSEDSLGSKRSQLEDARGDRTAAQDDLDAVHGDGDSDWVELRGWEAARNETTRDDLGDIDLGDLEDPGLFDKIVGGIADFVGGVLENIANLVEAFVTGDWATFFWELKALMETALLVLGTIALFTGIGGPLGAVLLGLAALSFAVNAGLYMTQTPNPQTGQTVGLGEVVISGVSAVFAGVTVMQTLRQVTRLNQAAGGLANATHTPASVFAANNAPGLRNGALFQWANQGARNANNGLTSLANMSGRYGNVPYRFPVTTRAPVAPGTVVGPYQQGGLTTVLTPGSWEVVTTAAPTPGAPPSTMGDRFGGKLNQGGFDGFNVRNGFGGNGPMFGPGISDRQVAQVTVQMRSSPDLHIVPAR